MKGYHDLHLQYDVLFLADVFEKIKNSSLKIYGSCPSHYLSAPALNWDAMLNMVSVNLELISESDADMYLLFEKCMRGGVSYISKIYSKSNNKYFKLMIQITIKHIIYLDANDLYGFAMSEILPKGEFKWIYPKEFDSNKYTSSSSNGFALEADPENSKKLRKSHNDYPLASDKNVTYISINDI